jgi:hypothetical protein
VTLPIQVITSVVALVIIARRAWQRRAPRWYVWTVLALVVVLLGALGLLGIGVMTSGIH